MSSYYIGADVHSNSTELAIENRGKIVARYSVPTSKINLRTNRNRSTLNEWLGIIILNSQVFCYNVSFGWNELSICKCEKYKVLL